MTTPRKVGEVFEDNGYKFKVVGIVGEYYSCERVWDSAPSPTVMPKKEAVAEEKPDYADMAYAQLKKICAEKGLDATGKKSDLIARLEG
mgnify:CR=1 FL=1